MKRILSIFLVLFLLSGTLFSFTTSKIVEDNGKKCLNGQHIDEDNDDYCDGCEEYVVVVIDFYAVNDLHGKFCNTDSQNGVYTLSSYLKKMEETDDNVVILSSGDMWQGTAESNLSRGHLVTEWMNEMGFVSMTLGNHEFDWGEAAIESNLEISEFPFLAINIYDNETGKLADYCTPSIMVELDGIQIGIIGAIGDCYSSISKDKVEGVHFKVGSELTSLVKAESERLRDAGADLIVYSLHDGHESNSSGERVISSSNLQKYYSPSLSNGSVDVVFEAHTHKYYNLVDVNGVHHLQGGGENSGISHVEIAVNSANGNHRVTESGYVNSSVYKNFNDDEETLALEEKYSEIIDYAFSPIGTVSQYYDDSVLEDKVAELYLEAGIEKWGDDYDIVLGGGFLRTRAPYNLKGGTVTYANLLSLLPFDNEIVLCKISGNKLLSRFVNNSSSDYHVFYSLYGENIIDEILPSETYYVIVDSYTAFYAYNGLTIVDYYDYETYARDLVAEAVKNGDI